MEAAIYENRRTLDAIRETQSQRDLFRNLITETTHYVAADFMRNSTEKARLSEAAVKGRRELQDKHRLLREEKHRAIYLAEEAEQMQAREKHLTEELEAVSEHLAKVINGVSLGRKIEQYRDDVEGVLMRLEEQLAMVEELSEQKQELELRKSQTEGEVDSLKSQLADYQQALDVQQTRAIQYRQAMQALEKARELCELPALDITEVASQQGRFREQERQLTEQLLTAQQRLNLARAATEQYGSALKLVERISGAPVAREQAWELAQQLLRQSASDESLIARESQIQRSFSDLHREVEQREQLLGHCESLQRQHGIRIDSRRHWPRPVNSWR